MAGVDQPVELVGESGQRGGLGSGGAVERLDEQLLLGVEVQVVAASGTLAASATARWVSACDPWDYVVFRPRHAGDAVDYFGSLVAVRDGQVVRVWPSFRQAGDEAFVRAPTRR